MLGTRTDTNPETKKEMENPKPNQKLQNKNLHYDRFFARISDFTCNQFECSKVKIENTISSRHVTVVRRLHDADLAFTIDPHLSP